MSYYCYKAVDFRFDLTYVDLFWVTFVSAATLSVFTKSPWEPVCITCANKVGLSFKHSLFELPSSARRFYRNSLEGTRAHVLKSWKPTQMVKVASAFELQASWFSSASRRWHQQDAMSFPAKCSWSATARQQLFPDFGQYPDGILVDFRSRIWNRHSFHYKSEMTHSQAGIRTAQQRSTSSLRCLVNWESFWTWLQVQSGPKNENVTI